MQDLELWYPVRNPINQNNLFAANPGQYKPLNQSGHPGNDFQCLTGTPIYSPVSGIAFYVVDSLGGDGIWIRTKDGNGKNYNIILWHMPVAGSALEKKFPFQIPTNGGFVTVKVGQFLGYTDTSGFPQEATGPHLHLGVMPADENWHALFGANGFLGCVDPKPFYNGKYAQDYAIAEQSIQTATEVLASPSLTPMQKVETDSALIAFIKRLFDW